MIIEHGFYMYILVTLWVGLSLGKFISFLLILYIWSAVGLQETVKHLMNIQGVNIHSQDITEASSFISLQNLGDNGSPQLSRHCSSK